MKKNLSTAYLARLFEMAKTPTENGYVCDVANYVYNPSWGHQYPTFVKTLSDDGENVVIREIRYFKRYDGTGTYESADYSYSKAADEAGNPWRVMREIGTKTLEDGCKRFSLEKLISFC